MGELCPDGDAVSVRCLPLHRRDARGGSAAHGRDVERRRAGDVPLWYVGDERAGRRCYRRPRPRGRIGTMKSRACSILALIFVARSAIGAQTPADSVVPSLPPRAPLPAEAATANITHFSFIAYGDTRGRHDGAQLQSEHQLVIESMLATIKKYQGTPDAIRFVVQSGDAVVNGSIAAQLNVSYIPLINRLTQEGGVP